MTAVVEGGGSTPSVNTATLQQPPTLQGAALRRFSRRLEQRARLAACCPHCAQVEQGLHAAPGSTVQPLGRHQYAVPLVDASPTVVVVTYANGQGVCACFAYDWDGDCAHVQAVAHFLRPIHA